MTTGSGRGIIADAMIVMTKEIVEYCQDENEWDSSTEESEYTDDGNVDEDAKCAAFYNWLESFLNDFDYEVTREFFENRMNIQIDLSDMEVDYELNLLQDIISYYTKKRNLFSNILLILICFKLVSHMHLQLLWEASLLDQTVITDCINRTKLILIVELNYVSQELLSESNIFENKYVFL